MRKEIFALIAAAAAGVVLIAGTALASAQANPHPVTAASHGYVMIHGHRTACDTLIGGDVNGGHTRFHVSPITNTCNDQFRALALCLGRTGSGTREYGPWKSAYGESNTSPCPVNTYVVEGAAQFPYHDRKTYCLYGCSSSLLAYQVRPGPAVMASGSQKTDCSGVHWQVTDVPNQAMITNWDDPGNRCGLQQSAVAKCEQRGSYHNFDGPWRTTAKTSQGICGTSYDIVCGGIRFEPTSGGSETTEWVWPNSDCDTSQPAAQLTAAQITCHAPWDGAKRITPGVFEADWEGQNCDFALQTKAACEGRFNGTKNYYSGIVKANELEDAALCPRDRPVLVKGSINFRESGFWVGWCEVWPTFRNCHT